MKKFIFLLICLLLSGAVFGEEGYASWYGGKFNGRLTANGEVYDMEKFTAAHKSLPFGTMVKVTNKSNGKFTFARINDRGPFIAGRIIDLSRVGAQEIDMLKDGVAYVSVEVVGGSTGKSRQTNEKKEKITGASGGAYMIQVGAFSVKENAYDLREKLEKQQLKIDFQRTSSGLIRVLVVEVTESTLARTKDILTTSGIKGFVVKKAS